MKPNFIIVAEIYNECQVAIFRLAKDLASWARNKGTILDPMNSNAMASRIKDKNGRDWFAAFIPKKCPPETVCHECLHLAWLILDSHDIEVTIESQEVLAYLQQYLARQILYYKKDSNGRNR